MTGNVRRNYSGCRLAGTQLGPGGEGLVLCFVAAQHTRSLVGCGITYSTTRVTGLGEKVEAGRKIGIYL